MMGPECAVCTAEVKWPSKITYIVDLNEGWCEQCARYGYMIGDQEFCSPAEICTRCKQNYSREAIVKIDLKTGERVCLACTKERSDVV